MLKLRTLCASCKSSNPTEKGNANEKCESKLVGEVTVEPGSKRIREVVRARAGAPLEGGAAASYRGDWESIDSASVVPLIVESAARHPI